MFKLIAQTPGLGRLHSCGQCMELGNYRRHFADSVLFSEVNESVEV